MAFRYAIINTRDRCPEAGIVGSVRSRHHTQDAARRALHRISPCLEGGGSFVTAGSPYTIVELEDGTRPVLGGFLARVDVVDQSGGTMPQAKQQEDRTMTYEWQNGDYILSKDLSTEDYREVAARWINSGVDVGEFPETDWLRDFEAFGINGGRLYHADCSNDPFTNGRRVELVNGRLQVADEESEQAPERTPDSRPMRLTIEVPGTITVQALGDALDALGARVVGVHGGDDV